VCPRDDEDWDHEVSTVGLAERPTPRHLLLRVLGLDEVTSHSLPPRGELVIGRSDEADIRLGDPSISRKHARLILGSTVQIEDLGSQNGTKVDGDALAPHERVELRPGQPFEVGGLTVVLQAAHGERSTPAARLPARARSDARREPGVIVEDQAMIALHQLVDRVAGSDIHVLLLGETGVGKEVVAQAVHQRSSRAHGPFVRINCGALPENLIESELFGYERGAFSGADRQKLGLIETADKGTLFLDEIGELSAATQVRLLRTLEDRRVQRLGSLTSREVDVRIVSATNRDLDAEVVRGAFRQDLLFRVDGMSIYIPPLRERLTELDSLCALFLDQAARRASRTAPTVSPEAREVLHAHRWPGNVRELRNVMERALLLSSGSSLTAEHIVLRGNAREVPSGASSAPPPAGASGELDRAAIVRALERNAGNQTLAAKELGISRGTLVARLEAFGIARPRKRR
jgi:transcriptional regulator with PAS, ATPase and Fis domain